MEYMSAGKPTVAFDLDETRYSAADSALLIEPGNLREFAEAIKKLICEPNLREKLGKCGQNIIMESLNWDNAAKELRQAYAQVLRGM
jgi:glycosyltransferase involved in cell wall biosynthesis